MNGKNSSYIPDQNSLIYDLQVFYHIHWIWCPLKNRFLIWWNTINFFMFILLVSATKSHLEKSKVMKSYPNVFLYEFYNCRFCIQSLIHLKWVSVYGVRQGSNFISWCYGYLAVTAWFAEKAIISALNYLGNLVENQLTGNVKFYFWVLSSIPLVYMSLLMPLSHRYDYCCFAIIFNSENRLQLHFFSKLF